MKKNILLISLFAILCSACGKEKAEPEEEPIPYHYRYYAPVTMVVVKYKKEYQYNAENCCAFFTPDGNIEKNDYPRKGRLMFDTKLPPFYNYDRPYKLHDDYHFFGSVGLSLYIGNPNDFTYTDLTPQEYTELYDQFYEEDRQKFKDILYSRFIKENVYSEFYCVYDNLQPSLSITFLNDLIDQGKLPEYLNTIKFDYKEWAKEFKKNNPDPEYYCD